MQPMYTAKVNSPTTQLAGNISATQTSIPVQDVNVLPPAPNLATIGRDFDAETILYTGVNTANNTLTGVTRGFQGTVKAWNAGEQVGRFYTAYDHDTFIANIQAAFDVSDGAKIYGRVGQWELMELIGDVVDLFTTPNREPTGLAWDGTHLWHTGYSPDAIYQLTTTGTIVSQFAPPAGIPAGLTWDGTHLWHSDISAHKIYQLTTTGTVVSQFTAPGTRPGGLAWDGTHLWNASLDTRKVYQLTTTGTVVSEFTTPALNVFGLTWDGTHLWNVDRAVVKRRIYMLTNTGVVEGYIRSPGPEPTGLTWDGTCLWNADQTTDKIYQVNVVNIGKKFRLVS